MCDKKGGDHEHIFRPCLIKNTNIPYIKPAVIFYNTIDDNFYMRAKFVDLVPIHTS